MQRTIRSGLRTIIAIAAISLAYDLSGQQQWPVILCAVLLASVELWAAISGFHFAKQKLGEIKQRGMPSLTIEISRRETRIENSSNENGKRTEDMNAALKG